MHGYLESRSRFVCWVLNSAVLLPIGLPPLCFPSYLSISHPGPFNLFILGDSIKPRLSLSIGEMCDTVVFRISIYMIPSFLTHRRNPIWAWRVQQPIVRQMRRISSNLNQFSSIACQLNCRCPHLLHGVRVHALPDSLPEWCWRRRKPLRGDMCISLDR